MVQYSGGGGAQAGVQGGYAPLDSGLHVPLQYLNGITATQIAVGTFLSALDFCAVSINAAQSIPNNTATTVTWNAEISNPNSLHSNVTNPSRITIKNAGIYVIGGMIEFAANITGVRMAILNKNGAGWAQLFEIPATPAGTFNCPVSLSLSLAVNDFLELQVFQTSGGALNLDQVSSLYVVRFV